MTKEEIIKEIIKRHPALGVDKNFSEYTGGMKDSGRWFVDVMTFDIPKEELREFLDIIEKGEKEHIEVINTKDESMLCFEHLETGHKSWVKKSEFEAYELFMQQRSAFFDI